MPVDQMVFGYVASEEDFADNAVIMEEGSKGNWVYVVLEGAVEIRKRVPSGLVTIDTLKEGAIFGEMAMLDRSGGVRSASAIANGQTRLGVLDTERIIGEFEAVSPQLRGFIRALIVRLKEATATVSSMVLESS